MGKTDIKLLKAASDIAKRSSAAAVFGALGGASGKGKSKTRPPEHYSKMVKRRLANKKKREKQAKNQQSADSNSAA